MRHSLRIASLALVLSAVMAAVGVPPASAAMRTWKAKVLRVSDGDTFNVRDTAGRRYVVRIIGINTAEGHYDHGVWKTDSCWSKPAHDWLERRIEGKWVDLKATDFNATGKDGRKLRYVYKNGVDLGQALTRAGLAVAYPNAYQYHRNAVYIRAARLAKRDDLRMWKPAACRTGPQQSAELNMAVRSIIGESDLNREYARVENNGATAVSLRNWVLRDSALNRYRFGDISVPAGGSVTVHTGSGRAWTTRIDGILHRHLYWGQSESIFAPEVKGQRSGSRAGLPVLGDGAYLYDPHLDLRAHLEYPCLGTCLDAMGDKVRIHVKYDNSGEYATATNAQINEEEVQITNISPDPIDLSSYMLHSWPSNYEIARYPRTILQPGETLVVHSGKDPASNTTVLKQYWGFDKPLFGKADYVELRTMEGKTAVNHVYDDR